MIEIKDLRKGFDDKAVLKGVTVNMNPGMCNLIIGSSGSGKTVFMKCLVGLFQPDSGAILYGGRDFTRLSVEDKKEIRKEIGMLFQGSALFSSMTVEENIIFPLDMFTDWDRSKKLDRVNEVLARVNLNGANKKFPAELSGGMMKRVGIARAIVLNPKYLFVDEPNSGLDPQTSGLIDKLIKEITEEFGITTIINTHDMNSVMEIGDHIVYMYQGEKEWEGNSKDIIFSKNERLNNFIFASDFLKDAKDMRMLEETGNIPSSEDRNIEEMIRNAEEPLIPPSSE
ncbi:phospholipid/cholesterol/gamma-HCH transport system ATP-binding protein [Cnuella takakiae]|uniref:Phospholipid/cholesterol/gamma-HCH transport system ATP-binding protein n=1 Tax=Cnuella takakiae TaxID=1302690 RepID=A0A1M5AX02_9BACT|nr:ATP-binding cassette domain-containing protein [Cnuella takakiae]OLY93254.1 ABC transporter ATP-binding protein [Cnuella takakiae]SHF34749.1 phospholipid/cholesterol/gamma-HCH transport system ATP-binding protein [Cnuella takakiae]